MDVGKAQRTQDQALVFAEDLKADNSSLPQQDVVTKPDFLFDCVELSIDEGGRYCILGSNGCGKSVLLRILAKLIEPEEGTVKHALNLGIGFLDQDYIERVCGELVDNDNSQNALSFLSKRFPTKTQKEIRGELTAFGLSPSQATTNIMFLSAGERQRLFLVDIMLNSPQLLILDNPTSSLDMESVEALVFGLSTWNGTVVMVSHDANFIREVDAKCFALVHGKLRRVDGIDAYLRSFAS